MNELQFDRRFATTLARGLSVLRAFRPSDDGLGNAEIAHRTGLPKSTVSRLTFTLQALGYLSQAQKHEKYRPGPALLALGNIASASISFVELSGSLMQRLADETKTLSILVVPDGNKMLIVKTWRPRSVSSLWLDVGYRLPFNGSSSGNAYIAALGDVAFKQLLENVKGDRGLSDERAAEIRTTAKAQLVSNGYVIADSTQYFSENVHAVSVPFQARDLSQPVVFTCGAMPADLSVERMHEEVGPRLIQAIGELQSLIGKELSYQFNSQPFV